MQAASRASGFSRRFLCSEGSSSQQAASRTTLATAPGESTPIAEALVPDVSDLQDVKGIASGAIPELSQVGQQFSPFSFSASSAPASSEASAGVPENAGSVVGSTKAEAGGDSIVDANVNTSNVLTKESSEAAPTGAVEANGVASVDTGGKVAVGEMMFSENLQVSADQKDSEESFVERLRVLVKKGRSRQAAGMLRTVLEESPESIDKDVVWAIMPSLARLGWAGVIIDTLAHARSMKMDLAINVYNCGLNGIMRSGRAEKCSEIVEYMWTLPIHSQPNATTYNHLIAAHFYEGSIDAAYDVLTEMKNRMIYPTWSTYHTLIAGCIRRDNPRRAFETLLAVEQQRFEMSALVIGQVLVACAEVDDVAALTQLIPRFDEALPRYAVEIERLAERRNLYKLQTNGEGMTLEQRVAARGEPIIELAAIRSVLNAAYRNSRPDLAEHALRWHSEWYPNTSFSANGWYCLIGAYASSGNLAAAFDGISRMRSAGLEADLNDLTESLVKPLSTDLSVVDEQYYRIVDFLRPEEAKARLEANAATGEVPPGNVDQPEVSIDASVADEVQDANTVETEASTSDSESPDLAQSRPSSLADFVLLRDAGGESLAKSGNSGVLADEERTAGAAEFNSLIAACSLAGDLDRAFHTYDEALRLGIERNADTFNALLLGCVGEAHYTGGIRVADEMKLAGVPFNSGTVQLLVRLSVRCGKFDEAFKVIAEAVSDGVEVSSASFQVLARKLMSIGHLEDLRKLIAIAETHGVSSAALLARIEGQYLDDIAKLEGDEAFVERERKPNTRGNSYRRQHSQEDVPEPYSASDA